MAIGWLLALFLPGILVVVIHIIGIARILDAFLAGWVRLPWFCVPRHFCSRVIGGGFGLRFQRVTLESPAARYRGDLLSGLQDRFGIGHRIAWKVFRDSTLARRNGSRPETISGKREPTIINEIAAAPISIPVHLAVAA
jgi:hypothetical protein